MVRKVPLIPSEPMSVRRKHDPSRMANLPFEVFRMRKLLLFLALLAVCVVALGIYQGWFQFTKSDNGSGTVNVNLSIDENKMKEDAERAKEKAKSAGEQAKEKINDAKPAPSKDRGTAP